ncbi:UDP binding domain-containing protein, partial [Thermodesulfobacteriota bacterium]
DRCGLRDKTIGVLGMAFKADNDDKRESLSYKLKKILEIEAKTVLCTDVYIKDPGFVSIDDLLARSDIVILGAPHREYAPLTFGEEQILVDVWNFYGQGGKI